MYSIAIFVLLVHSAVVLGQQDSDRVPTPSCPQNQLWLECGPPCDDRKCGKKYQCQAARESCGNPGCYCDLGFLRNSHDECVRPENCPRGCLKGEVFSECGNHCEKKCPTHFETINKQEPEICPLICGPPKCTCRPGYYRDPRGTCVLIEDCPDVCGENEKYAKCGNGCERSCDDYSSIASGKPPVKPCDRRCREPACVCKPGYYRNSQSRCVENYQCLRCPPNEMGHMCAFPVKCQRHCNYEDTEVPCENHHCRPGCICQPGYVRNRYDVCEIERNCFAPRPHH